MQDQAGRDLEPKVLAMMEAAWREPGFCVPNPSTYPHQWLWDSCFHTLVWLRLARPDEALTELASAMSACTANGFVPHMIYWHAPDVHRDLWSWSGRSTITQPPMYGHAVAELVRADVDVGADLVERCRRAFTHLMSGRTRTPQGLVPVLHPWESGCDDSARWDDWRSDDPTIDEWRERKIDLVGSLELNEGVPVANNAFTVGSIGFNALVAWNALEFCSVVDAPELLSQANDLADAVAKRWSSHNDTWHDDTWHDDEMPVSEASAPSSTVRTVDALLALLIDPRQAAFDQLIDPGAYGAPCGPCGVHRTEPTFDPTTYWRGPSWPQLTYLLMVAAERHGRTDVESDLAVSLWRGAVSSRLAEYWNPDTGAGLGARPQSWAGLGLLGRPTSERL